MEKHEFWLKFRIIFASVATVAWVVTLILDALLKDFEPHGSITPTIVIVAGFIFGGEAVAKFKDKDVEPT